MKTVRITESFTGYPAGKKRSFRAGEEVELANDFADTIVGKGHGREIEAPATPAKALAGKKADQAPAAETGEGA